ncbi:MAG: stage III sporulation protein AE [Clostridia bacterium]|nr:stage III sporulation protein AE [Clostridia bacterium]
MKKIILVFILAFLFVPKTYAISDSIIESQKTSLNISGFLEESKKYTEKIFPDIDLNTLLGSAITGNIDNKTILNGIINLFGKELKDTLKILASILIIVIIHSIFKSISDNLENTGITQITYYVQYILIVTIIMSNFVEITNMAVSAINNLVSFMYMLTPILITLLVTTGSIASANIVQPMILFVITFIGNIVSNIIMPIILVSTVFSVISNISSKIQIDKLSSFFKSGIVWGLGIMLTIFVGLLSLEGTLGSSIDGLTAKTAKAAVSNFIPVVGKVLGDSIDTVLGCASILKNAVGVVGVIIIVGICITPIIKLASLTIIYHLASAICQPIADEKIVKLLEQIGGTFKVLLAIMCSISVMLMIGTTLVVKISNSGLMYR